MNVTTLGPSRPLNLSHYSKKITLPRFGQEEESGSRFGRLPRISFGKMAMGLLLAAMSTIIVENNAPNNFKPVSGLVNMMQGDQSDDVLKLQSAKPFETLLYLEKNTGLSYDMQLKPNGLVTTYKVELQDSPVFKQATRECYHRALACFKDDSSVYFDNSSRLHIDRKPFEKPEEFAVRIHDAVKRVVYHLLTDTSQQFTSLNGNHFYHDVPWYSESDSSK